MKGKNMKAFKLDPQRELTNLELTKIFSLIGIYIPEDIYNKLGEDFKQQFAEEKPEEKPLIVTP
jgi:hypothetical protein